MVIHDLPVLVTFSLCNLWIQKAGKSCCLVVLLDTINHMATADAPDPKCSLCGHQLSSHTKRLSDYPTSSGSGDYDISTDTFTGESGCSETECSCTQFHKPSTSTW